MTTVQTLNDSGKMKNRTVLAKPFGYLSQKQKSCKSNLQAYAVYSTFNFAQPHPKPTHHPDKPTNTNLWNKKIILLLSFLLLAYLTGFSQSYLERITKQVNFQESAKTEYPVISSLKVGTKIFFVSLETENDFYNINDIATDKEGYILKSSVKVGQEIEKDEQGMFTPSGQTTIYIQEIEIYNNSKLTLTIKLNSETYSFAPQQKKTITMSPGTCNFKASARNVIPNIGTEYMQRNQGFTWQIYIGTERK